MRRIHVPKLHTGVVALLPKEARHARDVLRLQSGTAVEVFDDAGRTGSALLLLDGMNTPSVQVESVAEPPTARMRWDIAAAVPKGERADWMVEKLSELGTDRFIPIATARSVVLPQGKNKRERWVRLATESAKQSRRSGVMKIDELTPLARAVQQTRETDSSGRLALFLTTAGTTRTLLRALTESASATRLTLFIGPEGGWTDDETAQFVSAGMLAVALGDTILRVETAAVAAAVIASCCAADSNRGSRGSS